MNKQNLSVGIFPEFIRFCIVGVITFSIYYLLIYFLINLKINELIAISISYFCAVCLHFYCSKFFTFKKNEKIKSSEIFSYLKVTSTNLFFQLVSVYILTLKLDINIFISSIVANIVFIFLNYFFLKKFTFS